MNLLHAIGLDSGQPVTINLDKVEMVSRYRDGSGIAVEGHSVTVVAPIDLLVEDLKHIRNVPLIELNLVRNTVPQSVAQEQGDNRIWYSVTAIQALGAYEGGTTQVMTVSGNSTVTQSIERVHHLMVEAVALQEHKAALEADPK